MPGLRGYVRLNLNDVLNPNDYDLVDGVPVLRDAAIQRVLSGPCGCESTVIQRFVAAQKDITKKTNELYAALNLARKNLTRDEEMEIEHFDQKLNIAFSARLQANSNLTRELYETIEEGIVQLQHYAMHLSCQRFIVEGYIREDKFN